MDKGDESMSSLIRAMTIEDKHAVMDMMKEFYSSDAVFSNGSEEISLTLIRETQIVKEY